MTTTELIAIMAAILQSGHGIGQLLPVDYVKAAIELYKAAADAVDNDPGL